MWFDRDTSVTDVDAFLSANSVKKKLFFFSFFSRKYLRVTVRITRSEWNLVFFATRNTRRRRINCHHRFGRRLHAWPMRPCNPRRLPVRRRFYPPFSDECSDGSPSVYKTISQTRARRRADNFQWSYFIMCGLVNILAKHSSVDLKKFRQVFFLFFRFSHAAENET